MAIVYLAVIAVRRRWRLISGPAAALGRIGRIRPWVESKRDAIQSVEDRLLDFFHYSPAAFRRNLALQMAGQVAAVLEVYLILRLMGHSVGFSSALAIEGLTKLVNVIGMINPGNTGTYEGGNMLFAKLVGVSWNRRTDAGADPQSPRSLLGGGGCDLCGDAARIGAA